MFQIMHVHRIDVDSEFSYRGGYWAIFQNST